MKSVFILASYTQLVIVSAIYHGILRGVTISTCSLLHFNEACNSLKMTTICGRNM